MFRFAFLEINVLIPSIEKFQWIDKFCTKIQGQLMCGHLCVTNSINLRSDFQKPLCLALRVLRVGIIIIQQVVNLCVVWRCLFCTLTRSCCAWIILCCRMFRCISFAQITCTGTQSNTNATQLHGNCLKCFYFFHFSLWSVSSWVLEFHRIIITSSLLCGYVCMGCFRKRDREKEFGRKNKKTQN